MSSSVQGGSGGGRKDKPPFFVKYIKKAGKVLKRSSSKGPPSDLPAEPGQNAPAVTSR